jgi:hypothetical protein
MLRAHDTLLTRSRRADADYATSKRCFCAHVASVRKHVLRAHVSLLTRSRGADAGYANSERDAKRARRADADQKNAPTQYF